MFLVKRSDKQVAVIDNDLISCKGTVKKENQLTVKMSKRVLEKWSDCLVTAGREPVLEILDEFERVLGDAADERPLQTLFAASPVLLGPLVPPGGNYWGISKNSIFETLLAIKSSSYNLQIVRIGNF